MTDLSDLIRPGAVGLKLRAADRRDALAALSVLAADAYGVDAARTLEAAVERERLGGTGVGEGVAIPHARVDGVDRPVAVVAVFETAVDFEGPDGRPADIVVLLLSPMESGADHLKALAKVSRVLRRSEIRELIRSARTAAALHAVLGAAESRAA